MKTERERKRLTESHTELRKIRERWTRFIRTRIESEVTDEGRRKRLWKAAATAQKRKLWIAPIRQRDGYCKDICYSILAHWHRHDRDAALSEKYHGPWGKSNWLHANGWTACGEVSTRFADTESKTA